MFGCARQGMKIFRCILVEIDCVKGVSIQYPIYLPGSKVKSIKNKRVVLF